ncbi:MAG: hypothetical protein ACOYIF_05380 [Acetivibrionales bacterium]|jgi:hypothetical protein
MIEVPLICSCGKPWREGTLFCGACGAKRPVVEISSRICPKDHINTPTPFSVWSAEKRLSLHEFIYRQTVRKLFYMQVIIFDYAIVNKRRKLLGFKAKHLILLIVFAQSVVARVTRGTSE